MATIPTTTLLFHLLARLARTAHSKCVKRDRLVTEGGEPQQFPHPPDEKHQPHYQEDSLLEVSGWLIQKGHQQPVASPTIVPTSL